MNIEDKASLNAKNILIKNYKIDSSINVLIIHDDKSKLSQLISKAFEAACSNLGNNFNSIEFYSNNQEDILLEVAKLNKGDIVVLVQSSSFRVSNYRWRNELCDKGFKVVEFSQLEKMDTEIDAFVESLTDDYDHYDKISKKLVECLSKSKKVKIISKDGSIIEYNGEMDRCIRNTGSLWEQTNWTTRYPIGEVITEALDLETLNGKIQVYAYPSLEDQRTKHVKAFNCEIKNGYLVSHDGPEDFSKIVDLIKTENEKGLVFVREFGIGLNRHIKKETELSDPQAYERVEGMHFSIGMKHGMYQKKLWKEWGKKFNQKFHIDLYVDIKEMYIDQLKVYDDELGYF